MFLFLNPDFEANYYKIAEGKDVYGKSIFRQCVSIPLSDVPRELLHVVQGKYTITLLWLSSFLGMGHIASQNHRFSFLNLFLLILIFTCKSLYITSIYLFIDFVILIAISFFIYVVTRPVK